MCCSCCASRQEAKFLVFSFCFVSVAVCNFLVLCCVYQFGSRSTILTTIDNELTMTIQWKWNNLARRHQRDVIYVENKLSYSMILLVVNSCSLGALILIKASFTLWQHVDFERRLAVATQAAATPAHLFSSQRRGCKLATNCIARHCVRSSRSSRWCRFSWASRRRAW